MFLTFDVFRKLTRTITRGAWCCRGTKQTGRHRMGCCDSSPLLERHDKSTYVACVAVTCSESAMRVQLLLTASYRRGRLALSTPRWHARDADSPRLEIVLPIHRMTGVFEACIESQPMSKRSPRTSFHCLHTVFAVSIQSLKHFGKQYDRGGW